MSSSPHGSAGVQQSPDTPADWNSTFGSANASRSTGSGRWSSSKSAPRPSERGHEARGLAGRARPEQIEVAGQLLRAVEDPGNLTDHNRAGAVAIQRGEQQHRIEADGIVAVDRAVDVVGIVVRDTGTRAITHVVADAAHRVGEPLQRSHRHRGSTSVAIASTIASGSFHTGSSRPRMVEHEVGESELRVAADEVVERRDARQRTFLGVADQVDAPDRRRVASDRRARGFEPFPLCAHDAPSCPPAVRSRRDVSP